MKPSAACLLLACIASALSAQTTPAAPPTPNEKVETGVMNGAPYRIDMPNQWNGILLVYYHGYSEDPVTFTGPDGQAKPNPIGAGFANAGFEVVQSGYSVVGFALEQAIPETEALREYAIAKYGQPRETYVTGHSMGGQLTMATLERYPNRYDGGLALCGLLQPTNWAVGRGGAMRAAFDYYYPGILPGPIGIPVSVELNGGLVKKALEALPTNPKGLAELMALTHFKNPEDLAWGVVFSTFIERDFEQKIGAPILDNHNFMYAGGPDDNALNDGVKRYTATDAALNYLTTWYTPTGVLLKPLLAVHTTYDPVIPADSVRVYAEQVQRAGSSANFVQQYVKHDGHCNIDGPETFTALKELLSWKHDGKRPESGAVPVPQPAK